MDFNDFVEPFIALGLVENRKQAKEIVLQACNEYDEKINFEKFLDIIRYGATVDKKGGNSKQERSALIFSFCKSHAQKRIESTNKKDP